MTKHHLIIAHLYVLWIVIAALIIAITYQERRVTWMQPLAGICLTALAKAIHYLSLNP